MLPPSRPLASLIKPAPLVETGTCAPVVVELTTPAEDSAMVDAVVIVAVPFDHDEVPPIVLELELDVVVLLANTAFAVVEIESVTFAVPVIVATAFDEVETTVRVVVGLPTAPATAVLDATADVNVADPALSQGAITH
jgi:hypothetical protein